MQCVTVEDCNTYIMRSFWLEANLCRFLSLVIYVLPF